MLRVRKKRVKKSAIEDGKDEAIDLGSSQLATEKELAEMLDMDVGEAKVAGEVSDEVAEKLEMLEGKISRLETLIDSLRRESGEHLETMEEMRENLIKLMSIYEIVSRSMNPFVDSLEKPLMNTPDMTRETEQSSDDIGSVEELPPDIELISIEELGLNPEPTPADRAPANISEINEAMPDSLRMVEIGGADNIAANGALNTDSINSAAVSSRDDGILVAGRPGKDKSQPILHPLGPEKPILSKIDGTPENIITILRWIEFLLNNIPRESIEVILEYYVSVGWISRSVKNIVMLHARGQIREPSIELHDGGCDAGDWRMNGTDHIKSLMFITLLGNNRLDRKRIRSIESDIANIVGGGDERDGT